MTQTKTKAGCSSVPLDPLVGLESADMDIADRLHGYAMLHKGMTPESWAMAEGRDEIIGLRQSDLLRLFDATFPISAKGSDGCIPTSSATAWINQCNTANR